MRDGATDIQRYDHATAVSRGEEVRRLRALLYALSASNPTLYADEMAFTLALGPNPPRVDVWFDAGRRAYVLPGLVVGG